MLAHAKLEYDFASGSITGVGALFRKSGVPVGSIAGPVNVLFEFIGGAAMMGSAAVGSGVGMMAGAGIAGLFMFIAFIADIVLIVFCALPGTPGDNRYGPPPAIGGGGTAIPAE